MTSSDRRRRLLAVLTGRSCVFTASIFDPISARIAEEIGFEVGILGGSIASFAILGAPNLMLLTLTELAEQVRRIARCSAIPLVVDADNGYGNALSVMRTVQELETVGAAALTIEDTLLPRPFGDPTSRLVSLEEGLGKMKAALAARHDPSFAIIARTSAMSLTGIDDAIARVSAYAAAGVDGLFFPGISARSQIEAVRSVTQLPIVLGGTKIDLGGPDDLAALGVRIAMQGHRPFRAAVRAMHAALSEQRTGTVASALDEQGVSDLVATLTRANEYEQATRDFLTQR